MAIAALAHRYVFPASPYFRSPNYVSRRKLAISSTSGLNESLLEIDEVRECRKDSSKRFVEADVKVSSTSLKDSVQDVVLGGGETVRILLLHKNELIMSFLIALFF